MAFTMASPNFKKGLKMAFGPLGVKLIFPVFSEEFLHVAMWLKLPLKGRVLRKKFLLPIESWFFTFFHFFQSFFFAHGFA
jgi:hypothetical protein